MNNAPSVTALSKTVRLGNKTLLSSLFTASDVDGDPITKIQILDSNSSLSSGKFEFNGAALAAGVWHTFDISQLNLLRFAAAASITTDSFSIRVFDGTDWSLASSAILYSVQANTNKPIGLLNDLTVVAYEKIKVSNFVTAFDVDGYPITKYKFRDRSTGVDNGFFEIAGVAQAQNTWLWLDPAQFNSLYYVAALGAVNETIDIRVFDGGLWSTLDTAVFSTLANANRPVVQYAQYLREARSESFVNSLFSWTDEDNNTAKSYSFFDIDAAPESGFFSLNGSVLPSGQWFDVTPAQLANLKWTASSISQSESFNVRVFDGRFQSFVQRIDFQTIVRPTITGNRTTILAELEVRGVDNYFTEGGEGPAFSIYEVMDLNPDTRSARLVLDGSLLSANTVHELSAAEFARLNIRGGTFENRWLDQIVVRAFNGLWTPWTMSTFNTEPEYDGAILGGTTWLDLLPPTPPPLPITYSFMQNYPGYQSGDASPLIFSRFTNQQRAAARLAFEYMERFANIDFVEIGDSDINIFGQQGGLIRFGNMFFPEANPPYLSYSFEPRTLTGTDFDQQVGDIWMNTAFVSTTNLGLGTIAFKQMLLEIAHAIGLKDPLAGIPSLPAATANVTHTVMSGSPRPDGILPANYMLYDVLAVQQLYGENSNFASGDNLYDIPTYWNGKLDILDMIWDTDGHDTIDASASLTSSRIDLREGSFSDIGNIRNNIAISFGTVIEDAIGGSNNDVLLGNQAVNFLKGGAGHDTIGSGASNDTMQGDAGNDIYEWTFGDGSDLIDENAGAGRDRIRIASIPRLDSLSEDFRFSLSGNDMLIDLRFDGSTEAILRVKNQMQGSSRIETLEFAGISVDLVSLSSQITAPEQRFELTANTSAFGFLVAPVV